jgi:hypothetical protein
VTPTCVVTEHVAGLTTASGLGTTPHAGPGGTVDVVGDEVDGDVFVASEVVAVPGLPLGGSDDAQAVSKMAPRDSSRKSLMSRCARRKVVTSVGRPNASASSRAVPALPVRPRRVNPDGSLCL